MTRLNAANNARTTLAEYIAYDATSLIVASAAVMPTPPYRITVDSEIMTVTAVSGNTLTVARGQEGTAATEHFAGVYIDHRWTAGMYDALAMAIAQIPNEPLLDNYDFTDPVNQRGQTTYLINDYTIDRWVTEVPLTVNNGYLALSSGGAFYQRTPEKKIKNLLGKTVTLSLEKLDGSYLSGAVTLPIAFPSTINPYTAYLSGNLELAILLGPSGSTANFRGFSVYNGTGSDLNIKRVMLELGSASTLANAPPADYGEELAICQRYFEVISIGGRSMPDGSIYLWIPYKVKKRSDAPSATLISRNGVANKISYFDGSAWVDVDATVSASADSCFVNATIPAYYGWEADLRVSADL